MSHLSCSWCVSYVIQGIKGIFDKVACPQLISYLLVTLACLHAASVIGIAIGGYSPPLFKSKGLNPSTFYKIAKKLNIIILNSILYNIYAYSLYLRVVVAV